ncbi:MAG: MFS transporter, partial [Acholeplasmataceae bacterium]|nr:MFS transporter [Acholeplasmataceae bacterium]
SPLAIYISGILMGFGISGPGLIPHTMYGDVIDAGQIKLKDCLDGQISGFTNFFNKIAQTVGLSLVMFLISLAGFREQQIGVVLIIEQPDSAMLMIRVIMAIAPLIFRSIGIFISN